MPRRRQIINSNESVFRNWLSKYNIENLYSGTAIIPKEATNKQTSKQPQ